MSEITKVNDKEILMQEDDITKMKFKSFLKIQDVFYPVITEDKHMIVAYDQQQNILFLKKKSKLEEEGITIWNKG